MNKFYPILFICLVKFILAGMDYICDNIYLGDTEAAGQEEYLKENNISLVINCANRYTSKYKEIRYIELNLYDDNKQKIFPKFDFAYRFIKKNPGIKILVHCLYGKSRSASFVIFYLMKEKGWDYDTCYNFVKEKRPVISPNIGFVNQLKEYYENNIKK